MRIFESNRTGDHRPLHNYEFPRVFAVCRAIYPRPEFQICNLVEIGSSRNYMIVNNREHVRTNSQNNGLNLSRDSEFYFVNENPTPSYSRDQQYIFGDINIVTSPRRSHDSDVIQVNIEICNLFLVNQHTHIPIVLFYNNNMSQFYPQPNILITPINMSDNTDGNFDLSSNRSQSIRDFLLYNTDTRYIRNMEDARRHRYEYLERIQRLEEYEENVGYYRNRRDSIEFRNPFQPLVPPPHVTRRTTRRELRRAQLAYAAGTGAGEGAGANAMDRDSYYSNEEDIEHEILANAARTLNRMTRNDPNLVTPPTTRARSSADVSQSAPSSGIRLQSFTIKALIDHAIHENMACPIGLTPIDKNSACMTTCQHIFNRENIEQWLVDHSTCPVCRETTQICESSSP